MVDGFRRFANTASRGLGTSVAFTLAVLAWAVTWPLFHFSDSWQLVINTGITVVTFLMVFLIRATQTGTPPRCTSSSTSSSAAPGRRETPLPPWRTPRRMS